LLASTWQEAAKQDGFMSAATMRSMLAAAYIMQQLLMSSTGTEKPEATMHACQ
jgi:hypothetical protein